MQREIKNNFELISFANADELARAVAGAWLDEIESASRAGKTYCVALSGGRITQKFFTATVEQAKVKKNSFEHIHFFWADERCVPPTDPDSNFKLANKLLLSPLKVSSDHIHRLRGELELSKAVEIAEAELRRFAPPDENGLPALDLVLLGLGEDGHVASLFPNAGPDVLGSRKPFLAVENAPKPPPRRISLSYAALKVAKKVWVLAAGAGKREILRESLLPDGSTPLARVIQSRPPLTVVKIFNDQAGFDL